MATATATDFTAKIAAVDTEEQTLLALIPQLRWRSESNPRGLPEDDIPASVRSLWDGGVKRLKEDAQRSGYGSEFMPPTFTNSEAYSSAVARLNSLNADRGDLNRAAAAARHERGVMLASAFTKDAQTQVLFSKVAVGWGSRLAHVAALANAIDAAVQAGADVGSIPPLPHPEISELNQFITWVKTTKRSGLDIADGLPPAISQRLDEAGR